MFHVSGAQGGSGAVLMAHLVLCCAVTMIGAVSLLCGLRRRPGRAWGRGTAVGLLLTALCVGALFLVNPCVHTLEDPSRLIEGALVINPVSAVGTALGRDILRAPWVYAHTDAADYLFAYPAPMASAGIFTTVGLIAQTLAAIRLRRAYR
jgi:hypothetical protein